MSRALRLLSQREHSRRELERKLAEYETASGELARVLDELESKGLIHEARVVASVVHRRAGKLGTARVRQELLAKGLSPDLMAEALGQLQQTETERAQALWARKFLEPAADLKERARQVRFLIGRGFSADVVRKIVHRGVCLEDDTPSDQG
jgi:regulatory protein